MGARRFRGGHRLGGIRWKSIHRRFDHAHSTGLPIGLLPGTGFGNWQGAEKQKAARTFARGGLWAYGTP